MRQNEMQNMEIDYFVGIDGGGSKTAFRCFDRTGRLIGEAATGAAYYPEVGVPAVIERLKEGIGRCLPAAAFGAVGFGMPGYGENEASDREAVQRIAEALAPLPVRFENDVTVGWAGALALSPGVSIVGGTGSIAYGRDSYGNAARCGGWHELFSDEGSGFWLGKKLLEIFSKQSDSRLEKTHLYFLVKERLRLNEDMELAAMTQARFAPSRKETAALQPILLEAARAKDPHALACYREAASELAGLLCGVLRQLEFREESIRVSYTGGLFQIEDLILQPVRQAVCERMRPMKLDFCPPRLSPCEGAALLAAEVYAKEGVEKLLSGMLCT